MLDRRAAVPVARTERMTQNKSICIKPPLKKNALASFDSH
jgi:hypothetical protein